MAGLEAIQTEPTSLEIGTIHYEARTSSTTLRKPYRWRRCLGALFQQGIMPARSPPNKSVATNHGCNFLVQAVGGDLHLSKTVVLVGTARTLKSLA